MSWDKTNTMQIEKHLMRCSIFYVALKGIRRKGLLTFSYALCDILAGIYRVIDWTK